MHQPKSAALCGISQNQVVLKLNCALITINIDELINSSSLKELLPDTQVEAIACVNKAFNEKQQRLQNNNYKIPCSQAKKRKLVWRVPQMEGHNV